MISYNFFLKLITFTEIWAVSQFHYEYRWRVIQRLSLTFLHKLPPPFRRELMAAYHEPVACVRTGDMHLVS